MTKSRSSSISSSDLPGGSRSSSISVVPDALENGASNVKDAMGGGVDNVQDAAANAQAACTNCCTCQCCAQTDQDARRADGASRGGSNGGNPFDQAMRDGQKNRARRGSHSSASSHSHSSHSFDAPNGCCGIPIACCCCACCMTAGAGAGSKVAPTPARAASSGQSGNLFDDGSVITLKHVGSGEYVQVNSSDDIDAKSGGCDWERAHWRVHTDDGGRTVRLENVDHDGFYIRTNKQGDELDPQGNPGGPRGLWVVGEHDGYTTFKSEMFGDEQKYYMGFNGKGEKKAPEDTGKGVHGQFEVAFAPER